jgi:hypothetical protein
VKQLQFCICLFALLTISCAQSQILNSWQLGVRVAPEYSYRAIPKDYPVYLQDFITRETRNQNELPQLGLTAGVRACYQSTRHFSFEAGIQYAHRGYYTKRNVFISLTHSGTPDGFLTYSRDYHSLAVPLGINYTLGAQKLRFLASLHLSPDYIIATQSVTRFESSFSYSSDNTDENLRKFNLYVAGGGGISYTLNDRFQLRLEAIFRHSLLQVSAGACEPMHLWSAGLDAGLYYQL